MIPGRGRRILIVTERFHPENFPINDLALQLAEDGLRVAVLTQAPSYPRGRLYPGWRNRPISREDWGPVRVIRIRTRCGYGTSLLLKVLHYVDFMVLGSLAAAAVGTRFDEVLVYHAGSLTMAVPAIVAAARCRARLSLWTLDLWPETVHAYGLGRDPLTRPLLDRFVRFVYGRCGGVFVPSMGFVPSVSRYVARSRIYFLPNWLPSGQRLAAREPGPARAGCIRFTFAGTVGRAQGLDAVVHGFLAAHRSRPGFAVLRILGDGTELPALRRAAEGCAAVEFLGRVPADSMAAVFADSDVLVLPLRKDPAFAHTVPWKFQSYLAAGKPILCAAGGEMARIVLEDGLGLTADPGNAEDIARAFLEAASMKREDLERIGARGAALLRQRYDKDTLIGRVESYLGGGPFEPA